MKKWRVVFFLVCFAFALVFLLIYRALHVPVSGQEAGRNNKPGHVDYVRSFTTPFHVADLRYYKGRLLLYNTTDMQLVETDTLGLVISRYGTKGDNLGEFRLITGWDVDDFGVYITDERKSAITEIDSKNSVVMHKQLSVPFSRANRVGTKKYLLRCIDTLDLRREPFTLVNISNDSMRVMDYPFPKVPFDLALDGFLMRSDEGESYYLCHWAGWFFYIDSNAALIYKRETIDRTPPPTIQEGSGHLSMDADAKLVNISASTDQKNLYILSRAYTSTDDSTAGVVDVYDRKAGEYVFSLNIPPFEGKRPRAIAYSNSGLYVVQSDAIVYYRFARASE